MESKGYAITFFLVMAIICTGAYVAVSALRANRNRPLVQIARPKDATESPITMKASTPTRQPATPTAAPPTETPQLPIVLPAQSSPTPSPRQRPAPVGSSPTTTGPLPTETPHTAFLFVQDGPVTGDFRHACEGGAYIFGTIRDVNGNKLEGVHVQATDGWGNRLDAVSKGSTDQGKYDIPISSNVQNTWNVAIVDSSGTPFSAVVPVYHAGQYVPKKEACWHRLDWRRSH